jgi:hypothetical protein
MRLSLIIATGGLFFAYVARDHFPFAYFAALMALFVATLVASRSFPRAKVWIYSASFVFLALALAEAYGAYYQPDGSPYPYVQHDTDLGYTTKPGMYRSLKTYGFGTRTIFDVTVTIDDDSRRRTVPNNPEPAAYFFGSSLTFGDGVEDHETIPSTFAALTGMRAVNFGVGGYGPHQTLRMLETGRTGTGPAKYCILTTHVGGIGWASGHRDINSPYYVVKNGRAVYAGTFESLTRKPPRKPLWERALLHSQFYRMAWPNEMLPSQDLNVERERFAAIVTSVARLAIERHGCRFTFVLWPERQQSRSQLADADWIETALTERGLDVLRLSRHVHSDFKNWRIYMDGHPNALAIGHVAAILREHLALPWAQQDIKVEPD